jgi:transcription antitermination factor NusG
MIALAYTEHRRWFVLLTESERKAAVWLERNQYLPYWPKYSGQEKLARGRRRACLRSVIPGYIFLPLANGSDPDWKHVLGTPGVREVIRDGEHTPISIGNYEIGRIRDIEAALNSSPLCAAEGIPFHVGQIVRVRNDMLWSWRGPIVHIDKGGKITIEADVFGRRSKVVLPVHEIEAM